MRNIEPKNRQDREQIRRIQKENEKIRKRNRNRIIVFAILLIFAIIGFVSVIAKLPFFKKSEPKPTADDNIYLAEGGDAKDQEPKADDVREAMDGANSKEGFTDKLQKILVVKEDTDVYTTDDSKSGTAGKISQGEYVNFYGSEDGWYKISTKDFEGYGKAEYFEKAKDGVFKVVDGVVIVNKEFSVPEDYEPGLSAEADQSFKLMQADMERANMRIEIASSFRSFEDQEEYYKSVEDENGQGYAEQNAAKPGHSEHQLGLAIDVNNDGSEMTSPDFKDSKEAEWLEENAHKYGFVIRYPKGKKKETGYEYQPWHLRYLGPNKAKEIYDSGLSLEEFYGL